MESRKDASIIRQLTLAGLLAVGATTLGVIAQEQSKPTTVEAPGHTATALPIATPTPNPSIIATSRCIPASVDRPARISWSVVAEYLPKGQEQILSVINEINGHENTFAYVGNGGDRLVGTIDGAAGDIRGGRPQMMMESGQKITFVVDSVVRRPAPVPAGESVFTNRKRLAMVSAEANCGHLNLEPFRELVNKTNSSR